MRPWKFVYTCRWGGGGEGGGGGGVLPDRAGAADGADEGRSDGGGADVQDMVSGHSIVRDASIRQPILRVQAESAGH